MPAIEDAAPLSLNDVVEEEAPAITDGSEQLDDTTFDKNITRFSDLSVSRLESLCMFIEPVAFSAANIKTVIRRGSRVNNLAELGNLLEAATNLTLDTDIPRQARSLRSLATYVREINLSLGRRMRDLTLPLAWEDFGIYAFQLGDEGEAIVTHRLLGERVQVAVPTGPGLYLQATWSEQRASLR